ncbi:KxYKxGKxW signal peptide domain-containing protein [Lacticaseibacillus paracasei]
MFKVNRQHENQDIKLHYKMYKDGKRWVFASLAVLGFVLGVTSRSQITQAATVQTPIANQVTTPAKSDTTQAKTSAVIDTNHSAYAADGQRQTSTLPQPTTAPSSKQTTAAPEQVSRVNAKTQQTPQASTQKGETPAKPALQAQSQTNQVTTQQSDQKTPATSAQVSQKTVVTPTSAKTGSIKAAATAATTKTAADDSYQAAQAQTDHANELAAKTNQSAAALQALLKDPKPDDNAWLTQVNAALNTLAKTASDFSGTKISVDEAVTAYQAALKQLPQPQPNAVQSVNVGDMAETATLENYNKFVTDYTAQVATILTSVQTNQANYAVAQALNAAQKQLKTAADQLNAAIVQAVASANAGNPDALTKPDANGRTLAEDKAAYDDALTAYNTNVAVYNAKTIDTAHKITPLGTNSDAAETSNPTKNPSLKAFDRFKDQITQAALQNKAYQQYEAANAASLKMKTTLADLVNYLSDWQNVVANYNKLIANDGLTATDLTTAQAAVTNAQTTLATTIKQFGLENDTYEAALTTYQTALQAYADQTGQAVQAATPGFETADPDSAWHQFQAEMTKLQADFDPTSATASTLPAQNEAIMQKNLARYQAIQIIGAAAQDLQTKISQINAAATAQQTAVKNWNDLITQAKADGRWAFFFQQLHAAGDDLTQKDYQYIDAVNGTTTTFTSKTQTVDYGKSYTDKQVGPTTANYSDKAYADASVPKDAQKASYTYLVNAYLKAVAAYNTMAADAKDKLSTGDLTDAAAATLDATSLKNSLESSNGFSIQYQKLINILASLAADPKQNDQALATLKNPDKLSTDGSSAPQAIYNKKVQTLTEAVVFGSGTWQNVLKSNFNLASFINEQTFNPTQYTVTDDKKSHQVSSAVLQQIFNNTWLDLDYNPVNFKLEPTYTSNGQKYYLAGYGVYQATNSDGILHSTNQIFTFTSGNAEQEFIKNGLKLSGDSSQNTYLIVYYLPITDYSQMIPTPTPEKAAFVKALTKPTTKLAIVSAYGTATVLPTPTSTTATSAKGLTYLIGSTPNLAFQSTTVTAQAPTMTLNQPVSSIPSTPLTPSKPTIPSTPLTPSKPTTPSTPLTPSKPTTPSTPLTPNKPTTPSTPLTPNKPTTPSTPLTPSKPTIPSTPLTPGKPTTPNMPLTPSKPETPIKPATTSMRNGHHQFSQAVGTRWTLSNSGYRQTRTTSTRTLPQTSDDRSTDLWQLVPYSPPCLWSSVGR